MTAEVAIANASAVALAADSAVTIGGQKIYNSALKLFSLSKIAPVGVMIYGNAALIDVQWEILIKEYRKELSGTTYDSLKDYAENFINFLNDNPKFFPRESQETWIISSVASYYKLIQNQLLEITSHTLREKGEISEEQIKRILSKIVSRHSEELKGKPFSEGMSEDFTKKVRVKYIKKFKEVREVVFEELKISGAVASSLYDLAALILTKQVFSTGVSGLVVAGYGEEDVYPSIQSYDIEGVIEDRLKYRKNKEKSHIIKTGSECSIIAFAQEDMVETFMNGLNPQVGGFIESYLGELFRRLPEIAITMGLNEEKAERFKNQSFSLLEDFFKSFREHLRTMHVDPVLKMVHVLPKDELAAMAEALVSLTAFKRRITESMETVGGPIDVAVISKGDGFIWVKRKHYFSEKINHHFFQNYFRGISNGEA